MSQVAIVDYGMCNLDSVKRAVEECGGSAVITDQEREISQATHVILPGVGAFGEAMANIHQRGLDEIMSEQVIVRQIPFLGICLGMQLMAAWGTEEGDHPGLGWIKGKVIRFQPTEADPRVPHIGWNEVNFQQPDSPLFQNIADHRDFYFVHSYYIQPDDPGCVIGTTPYCGGFTSALNQDWMYGVQFHPEKSQKAGFKLLENFLAM